MEERYKQLFVIPNNNLYLTGSPLLISSGVLLKDTLNDKVIALIKFRNISNKRILAIKVSLRAFDIFGKELEGVPEFQYLDLSEDRDSEFGQKTPILLPNIETRSFICACNSIIYSDGMMWSADSDDWEPLIKQETLVDKYGNLADQYRRDTCEQAYYTCAHDRDLWLCTCGAINRNDELSCHKCSISRASLKTAESIDMLQEHDNAYCQLCAEKAEKERLEAEKKAVEIRIAKETAAQKRKKAIAIVIPLFILCIAFIVVLVTVILPKIKYNNAMDLIANGDYDSAYALLEGIGNNEAIILSKHERASDLIDSGNYIEGYNLLEEIGCHDEIVENKYNRAISLIDAHDYESAYRLLREIGDNDTIYNNKYDRAIELISSGAFDKGYALLEEIKDYETIAANKYDRALSLIESGKYDAALELLSQLNYKDSEQQIERCYIGKYGEKAYNRVKNVMISGSYYFGEYEQDNNTSNGKERIEWIILDIDGVSLLLISKYALDCKPFNSYKSYKTWETCSLRSWLNSSFINSAFSSREQKMIKNTTVTADKNVKEHTEAGNDTVDKIFLLSPSEAYRLFQSDGARQCQVTQYSKAQGIEASHRDNSCYWWLRTPGVWQDHACFIASDGSVNYVGFDVDHNNMGVRPVMWIDLSKADE